MRQKGLSLAEVSLAVGVSAAIAATVASAGSFLMAKSKMSKLDDHARQLMAAVDAYSAAGGEANMPYPIYAPGNGGLLNTSLRPFMNLQTNPAQYLNPVQNATQDPVAMRAISPGNYCTDGVLDLSSSSNITITSYYGKIIYCAFSDLTNDNRYFYINNRGNLMRFEKYALATVDQYGWFSQVIGR